MIWLRVEKGRRGVAWWAAGGCPCALPLTGHILGRRGRDGRHAALPPTASLAHVPARTACPRPPSLCPQGSPKSPKEGGSDIKLGRLHPLLSALRRFVSPVLLEAFTLTFLAEWGDRSQIATIGKWPPPEALAVAGHASGCPARGPGHTQAAGSREGGGGGFPQLCFGLVSAGLKTMLAAAGSALPAQPNAGG